MGNRLFQAKKKKQVQFRDPEEKKDKNGTKDDDKTDDAYQSDSGEFLFV